ncbi:hypothetical protein FNV43_RR26571 [Rhamnella rubrinervis]|uniref:BAH domain-containing protein n=1 Tax=Rhamnella rubrinervis TaxID=2594499 RepID=A0A8K0DQ37_9ROSA|nr:hypothetical protein FNV43_RR26571 [Rhamnella rubrinervis]
MERMATAASATSSFGFVNWEEVFVSSDKGKREVHYYLKRGDGSSDLAVVGKEKSLRHMSYHYAFRNRSLFTSPSLAKLKSRREVVDWLNFIVSDTSTNMSSRLDGGLVDGKDASKLDVESVKDIQLWKLGHNAKEFGWLGSPWTSRKKRWHYKSFQRNGVKISVHDFVYVLAEEDKRLVAYLEDMYEDSRGNKMVVVRWFHKIDEVGIVLPLNYNDREIFFSLCLQDLSIECIDGLATVLSPQHFEKFLNEAIQTRLEPFVCHKQFENEDVKPFDITQVKGYWKQDILRYMYTLTPKVSGNSQQSDDDLKLEENINPNCFRPKKRQCTERRELVNAASGHVQNLTDSGIGCKTGTRTGTCSLRGGTSPATLPNKVAKEISHYFAVGSQVEVLSQDSGIRGCWFRALIIKKHKDRLKVRYQDIQDAADEANMLEEWILASRVASPDQLGLRTCGRTVVRPSLQSIRGRVSWVIDVGTVVDVWWHDGWWEGIVVHKESDDRLQVYFPGEKQCLTFNHGQLRHSQEWLRNGWEQIKGRPDLATSLVSQLDKKGKSCCGSLEQDAICESELVRKDESGRSNPCQVSECGKDVKVEEHEVVMDLSKDNSLTQLKWKSSRKRRRVSGRSVQKMRHIVGNKDGTPDAMVSRTCERFLIPASLKVDHENCKFVGDSLFSSSVVPPLTSLVMSR